MACQVNYGVKSAEVEFDHEGQRFWLYAEWDDACDRPDTDQAPSEVVDAIVGEISKCLSDSVRRRTNDVAERFKENAPKHDADWMRARIAKYEEQLSTAQFILREHLAEHPDA